MPFLPILTPFLTLCLALNTTAGAADDAIYQAAADRIGRSYLHLDQFDPALAFGRAGDAARSAVPWLLVDRQTSQGRVELRLSHGDTGVFATVAFPVDGPLSDLPRALGAIEDAVRDRAARGSDAPLPPDLDLSVELLRGASRALDLHSVVLSGHRLDEFNERIRGEVVGIGCAFFRDKAGLPVSKVFPDSPAALGGLRVGDLIRRVDGVSTLGMEYDDLVDRVRGALGTTVTVQVERVDGVTGQPRQLSLVFTRAEVHIPNVEWGRTQAGSGWIRIDHFSQQTYERALTDLSTEPAVDGLILDLRGDAGGSMIQAAKTVDLFVDSGLILR
ncbi:MAG: PDZ domain-containing protein [Oligoflexia bacterium]|nr:PDZ domain-containing protein [Oligoflexia bacterium]